MTAGSAQLGGGPLPVGRAIAPVELEELARRFALALGAPAFRQKVHDVVHASRYPEHKVELLRALAEDDVQRLVAAEPTTASRATAFRSMLQQVSALETYLPVPAHYARWTGGADVLVAIQERDGAPIVAFDTRGQRRLLSQAAPPETPVIVIHRAETDFRAPPVQAAADCYEPLGGSPAQALTTCNGDGWVPGDLIPGIHLRRSRIFDLREGWPRGEPEIEVLAQFSVNVLDPRGDPEVPGCAWEGAYDPTPVPTRRFGPFDQNSTDWTGSVPLVRADDYSALTTPFPTRGFRFIVVENDNEPCEFRGSQFDAEGVVVAADAGVSVAGGYAAIKKSVINGLKLLKGAYGFFKVVKFAGATLQNSDDMIGHIVPVEELPGASVPPGFTHVIVAPAAGVCTPPTHWGGQWTCTPATQPWVAAGYAELEWRE
ncbi:MAG: hypothetical protein NW201_14885 [Gemmatimonadales bacterium]|nr:hypothetical protein [Gemmatimonadales bacterium]